MIFRLIIAALLLYLLFLLVYSALRGQKRKGRDASEPGQDMVLDPHCKSYVPRKDAYTVKGHCFCSEACARAYLGE